MTLGLSFAYFAITFLAVTMIWRPWLTKSHNETMSSGQFVVVLVVVSGYIVSTLRNHLEAIGWLLLFSNLSIIMLTSPVSEKSNSFEYCRLCVIGRDLI